MFGFGKAANINEIDAAALQALLAANAAVIIDVREPDEFAAEHIAGATNLPLSRFDPAQLPDAGTRTMVLQCAGGKRSAMALGRCKAARHAVDTHLAGGLG
ncbi:MAG: rhodanese-like domain-containing protein, partial [Polymorphobacter sp.]